MTLFWVAFGAGAGTITLQSVAATMGCDSADIQVFDAGCFSLAFNELPKMPKLKRLLLIGQTRKQPRGNTLVLSASITS